VMMFSLFLEIVIQLACSSQLRDELGVGTRVSHMPGQTPPKCLLTHDAVESLVLIKDNSSSHELKKRP
jgi:hypothetical protein